jgi:hypothetical protein
MVQSAAHALSALHCSTLKMKAEFDYNVLMAFSTEHQSEAWAKDVARRTPKSAEHTVRRPFLASLFFGHNMEKPHSICITHTCCPTATPPPDA